MPGILIAIIIGGFLLWLLQASAKVSQQHIAEDATFAGEHDGWDIYKSAHDRGILALDHQGQRIAVGTVLRHVERSWSDISAVEIERNGQSLSQTNRGSQVMGAAVGAVLLGPVGLLMGGLTGSRRQKERVNELSLKILIDDRTAPVHRIVFFRMAGNGIDAKSIMLKEPAAKLEHFHALLANAIRHDSRSFASQGSQISAEGDRADRIAKLWELRQAGALTDDEFLAEKTTLLASRPLVRDNSARLKDES
jgi:hypothetical protein